MKLYASLALALLATLSGTQCMPMRAYSNYRDTFRHSDANADVDSYEDMADSTRDMDANQDVCKLQWAGKYCVVARIFGTKMIHFGSYFQILHVNQWILI